ncbi:MAG TPA: hypothetical protein DCZ10_12420 [Pelotomaculum sp.]|nr:hypothetical protein [Pelotomaculum sp.]
MICPCGRINRNVALWQIQEIDWCQLKLENKMQKFFETGGIKKSSCFLFIWYEDRQTERRWIRMISYT